MELTLANYQAVRWPKPFQRVPTISPTSIHPLCYNLPSLTECHWLSHPHLSINHPLTKLTMIQMPQMVLWLITLIRRQITPQSNRIRQLFQIMIPKRLIIKQQVLTTQGATTVHGKIIVILQWITTAQTHHQPQFQKAVNHGLMLTIPISLIQVTVTQHQLRTQPIVVAKQLTNSRVIPLTQIQMTQAITRSQTQMKQAVIQQQTSKTHQQRMTPQHPTRLQLLMMAPLMTLPSMIPPLLT